MVIFLCYNEMGDIMINLHAHTNCSDGILTPVELLKKFSNSGVKICSITDHDTVDAYFKIDNDISKYNIDKLIPGVEIKCTYQGIPIEILAYYIDIKKMKKYLMKKKKSIIKFQKYSFKKGKIIAKKLGLKLGRQKLKKGNYAGLTLYKSLCENYDYNSKILEEDTFKDGVLFYRKTFSNSNSPFFINEEKMGYDAKDVIDIIHKYGGLSFLAHIGNYYIVNDKIKFLKNICTDTNLDGVECYYPSHSDEDTKKYIDFCKKNKLLISGGSDFHGTKYQNVIVQKNIDLKNINWIV